MTRHQALIDRAKEALEGATPGPWVTYQRDGSSHLRFVSRADRPLPIARVEPVPEAYATTQDIEANARLIALAPDLARLAVAAGELAEVSERAIRISKEHDDFRLYAMEPMWQALARFRAIAEGKQ
jgi:hypothetical protein